MDEVLEKQALTVAERAANGNGSRAMVPTVTLPIAGQVSNEEIIAEERELAAVESGVGAQYIGVRGYLRLFQVSRVIGDAVALSLS